MLEFTLYTKTLFERAGVNVVLTRDRDVSMELDERTPLENKVKPDCFISLHMDGGQKFACGCTAWLHTYAPKSYEQWANDIIAELEKVGVSTNRCVKVNRGVPGDTDNNYYVNKHTDSPSMLLEVCFLTNDTNLEEYLRNYKQYAQAVVAATCRFLGCRDYRTAKAEYGYIYGRAGHGAKKQGHRGYNGVMITYVKMKNDIVLQTQNK